MRILKLSHYQIELIEKALENIHSKKMKLIENNKQLLNLKTIRDITKSADEYIPLKNEIINSNLDI